MLLTPVPCPLPSGHQSYSAFQQGSKSAPCFADLLASAGWGRAALPHPAFLRRYTRRTEDPVRILRDIPKRLVGFKLLRRFTSALILVLADGLALALRLVGAAPFAGGGASDPAIGLAPLLVAAWITLFTAFRLYDRAPVRRSPGGLVGAAFCWTGLVTIGAAIYPESGLTLAEIASAASLGLLCSAALRFLYERAIGRIYRRGFGQTPVLLIGDREGRTRLRRMMEQVPGAYVLAGEVDLGSGGDDAYLASR